MYVLTLAFKDYLLYDMYILTCICALKFPFCEKVCGQNSHTKGLSPVCFVIWICSAPFWLKALSQTEHLNGLSPEEQTVIEYMYFAMVPLDRLFLNS